MPWRAGGWVRAGRDCSGWHRVLLWSWNLVCPLCPSKGGILTQALLPVWELLFVAWDEGKLARSRGEGAMR